MTPVGFPVQGRDGCDAQLALAFHGKLERDAPPHETVDERRVLVRRQMSNSKRTHAAQLLGR